MAEIITLTLAKEIRPVVGRVIGFDDIPSGIDAMARRETLGRTVAILEQ
jgi:hypothetical protein